MHNNAQFTLALAVTKLEIFMVGEHIKILFQQLRSLGFLSPSFRVVFSLIWSKVKQRKEPAFICTGGAKLLQVLFIVKLKGPVFALHLPQDNIF